MEHSCINRFKNSFGALLSFTMISMEVYPGLRFLLESSNVFKTLETISNKCVECPLGIPLGTFVHILHGLKWNQQVKLITKTFLKILSRSKVSKLKRNTMLSFDTCQLYAIYLLLLTGTFEIHHALVDSSQLTLS